MSSIVIQGDTSGSITVEAPSVAGTHTLTLPKATGNIATDATVGLGTKNLIINGDMRIAQRGTSATGITGSGYYTVDRFQHGIGSMGTWSISQSTDVPSGQGFANSLKMDCTTADASPAVTDTLVVRQKIEGQMLQHLKKGTSSAEKVTVSFWVKSAKTGTYILELDDRDNTRDICQSYTIDTANTWEKKTLTFDGDTTGAFDNDNGSSFWLTFWLGAGTNFTSGTLTTSWASRTDTNRAVGQVNLADSTSNDWYITAVQLEVGENATPFEHRMYSQELAMCQRYFYKTNPDDITGGAEGGTCFTGTAAVIYVTYPVTMRATPSFSSGGTYNTFYIPGITGAATGSFNGTYSFYKRTGASLETSSMSGGALGYPIGYNGQMSFSAEL